MKKIITILILTMSASAFSYECKDHPFYSSTQKDGKKIGLFASSDDFKGAPEWNIEEGEPPLSVSRAVKIVKEWSKSFYPRFDDVEISGFSLRSSVCATVENQWVYVFELSPVIEGNQLHGSGYMVAITMAGKVLEPKEHNE